MTRDNQPSIRQASKTANQDSTLDTKAATQSALPLLTKVEILKVKTKLQKSVRVDTRSYFHVSVNATNETQFEQTITDKSNFSVSDSKGRNYKILDVTRQAPKLNKNANQNTLTRHHITIIADGSPQWFGTKYMSLKITEGTVGNATAIILSKNQQDIQKETVKQF